MGHCDRSIETTFQGNMAVKCSVSERGHGHGFSSNPPVQVISGHNLHTDCNWYSPALGCGSRSWCYHVCRRLPQAQSVKLKGQAFKTHHLAKAEPPLPPPPTSVIQIQVIRTTGGIVVPVLISDNGRLPWFWDNSMKKTQIWEGNQYQIIK